MSDFEGGPEHVAVNGLLDIANNDLWQNRDSYAVAPRRISEYKNQPGAVHFLDEPGQLYRDDIPMSVVGAFILGGKITTASPSNGDIYHYYGFDDKRLNEFEEAAYASLKQFKDKDDLAEVFGMMSEAGVYQHVIEQLKDRRFIGGIFNYIRPIDGGLRSDLVIDRSFFEALSLLNESLEINLKGVGVFHANKLSLLAYGGNFRNRIFLAAAALAVLLPAEINEPLTADNRRGMISPAPSEN